MATDIVSLLTHDEIPVKLRCARCNELALSAFRLPCCDQSICEPCRTTLPEECPVCAHSPLSPDDCKPNKNLRLTVKAFLKNEEKKREKAAAAAASAAVATPITASEESLEAQQTQDRPQQSQIERSNDHHIVKDDEVAQQTEGKIEPADAFSEKSAHGELPKEQKQQHSQAHIKSALRDDVVITTDFEQIDDAKPSPEQEQKEDQEQVQSQPKRIEQNHVTSQSGFGNGFGQSMSWNPAMMQQMMAMQNAMNVGNWSSFPMMGMNGLNMDPSMMNQMMGGMYMGNSNWGWNQHQQQQQQQQQQFGMGGVRMDNMMNMGGNFNANGSYGSSMANLNNGGAGHNAQLMLQPPASASAFHQPSPMNPDADHSTSDQVRKGSGGTGSGEDSSTKNEFLPGDASDSSPASPNKGAHSILADAPKQAKREANLHNSEAVFSPADDGSGASMTPYHVDGQQMTPYMQDDPSMMYPQMSQGGADFAYGNGSGYGSPSRAGFRGRASFRGRGGRVADADPVVALTGFSAGQGVAGAPTGPRAMREPPRGMPSGFRGGRGNAIVARGGITSPPSEPKGSSAALATRTDEQRGQDQDGRRSRSRSTSSRRGHDEGSRRRRRSRHGERSPSVNGREHAAEHREDRSDHETRTRESSAKRHGDRDGEIRRGSRRHSLTRSDVSGGELRQSSYRATHDYRTRSRSRSRGRSKSDSRGRSRSPSRDKDKERRRQPSRHHDEGKKSRNRGRERRRRRHRTRSPSPNRKVAEPDKEGGQRSSRRRRRREERRRERGRDRDRDRLSTKDSEHAEKDERDRHQPHDNRATHMNGEPAMPKEIPIGPRGDAAPNIPTGPRVDIPTGPRSQVQQPSQQQPREFKIHGRGAAPGTASGSTVTHHRRSSHGQQAPTASSEQYVDAHAQEREARNRERMLKEQQRRGSALTSSQQQNQTRGGTGSKRRASRDGERSRKRRGRGRGERGAKHGNDIDNDDEQRARRIENEREAARWE